MANILILDTRASSSGRFLASILRKHGYHVLHFSEADEALSVVRVERPDLMIIDIATPEGQRSGLRQDSAVICTNLFTIEKRPVLQRIGVLSGNLMSQIDACLKATLQLP